jgi:hypothetical protein
MLLLISSNANATISEGQYRVKATWGSNYLTGTNNNWTAAKVAPLNNGWNSQKWNFVKVAGTSNEYRISSQWPGNNYLTCDRDNWDNINVAPLNSSWTSQRWIVEKVGSKYRLRCKWANNGNKKYMHGSNISWETVVGAPLNTSWSSQIWELQRLGSSPSAPPLSSDAIDVGFEKHSNGISYTQSAQQLDWNVLYSSGDMAAYTNISNQQAHSGSKSLKVTYPDNAQIGPGAQYGLPPKNEYYLSYWMKFDSNFGFNGQYNGSTGGKLPGLASTGLCSGGSSCTGNNGFSSRYMWRENGRAVLYLYHMNKPGDYGEDIQLRLNGENLYFPTGQWFKMTQRVRINTGNNANGSLDIWFNDQKVLSRSNLKFVTNGNKVDIFYLNTFHGGSGPSWWPRYTTHAYFDDFIVSPNASDVGL